MRFDTKKHQKIDTFWKRVRFHHSNQSPTLSFTISVFVSCAKSVKNSSKKCIPKESFRSYIKFNEKKTLLSTLRSNSHLVAWLIHFSFPKKRENLSKRTIFFLILYMQNRGEMERNA